MSFSFCRLLGNVYGGCRILIVPWKNVVWMHTRQIGEKLFLIDLQTGGYPDLFASYALSGSSIAIVDPGPPSSVSSLLSGLDALGIRPESVAYVALSHVHIDHSGCTGALLKSLPNAKVLVHPRGAPHLINPEKLWVQSKEVLGQVAEVFGEPEPISKDRIIGAPDGMEFDLGESVRLKSVETLGHASHHLSFYDSYSGSLFPGDAAGVYFAQFDSVFPTSPPPFYPETAVNSLRKLLCLNPRTLCYPHFGQASDATARLKAHEEQIRLWVQIAEEGVKEGQLDSVICERILARDKSISKIIPYLKLHPILATTLIANSCDGEVEFARKKLS